MGPFTRMKYGRVPSLVPKASESLRGCVCSIAKTCVGRNTKPPITIERDFCLNRNGSIIHGIVSIWNTSFKRWAELGW